MSIKNISAFKIFELRKKTQLGVLECKNILELNNGDIDKSLNFIKKKWNTTPEKSQNINNKLIKYGIVIANKNNENTIGSIITLNCTSDFVSKNIRFLKLAEYISYASLLYSDNKSIMNFKIKQEDIYIKDMIGELSDTMKEYISFSFKRLSAPFISIYNHTGNKIASLVGFSKYYKGLDYVGKDIAMQIVAMNPIKNISSLMHQNFIKNENISVKEYLLNFNKYLKVINFEFIKL